MFVIGDIVARRERQKGKDVFFPIASHYSGNTAQHIAATFENLFKNLPNITPDEKRTLSMYQNGYGIPLPILKTFINPINILNYFNNEIIWELKSLDVSGDYNFSYTTNHQDFPKFINTMLSLYKKHRMLISNKNKDLALKYEDAKWKNKAINLLNKTKFIQAFHKNNVLTGIGNIKSDWGLLRNDGFGVSYKGNNNLIIDPMFDSELFTLFDLYVKYSKKHSVNKSSVEKIFINLFDVLNGNKKPNNSVVKNIIEWLPCDLFICEEHLKNWVAKKLYAESLLLNRNHQTKTYFMLGMGLLNGKRMSASRGNAILARNLITTYGTSKARLIILLNGGNPSKAYTYDNSIPSQVDKLLDQFINYYTYLVSLVKHDIFENTQNNPLTLPIKTIENNVEQNLNDFYYRQAVIELLSVIPKTYTHPNINEASQLIALYQKYLYILLPSLISNFN